MERDPREMHAGTHIEPGTARSYTLGFIACILLTVASYLVIDRHLFSYGVSVFAIMTLGIVQVVLQLVCFLHLGSEPKPRSNLLVFLFMLLVLVVIVMGSLWIMNNLDYRVMREISE